MSKTKPDDLDVFVGKRIQMARVMANMSQEKLAARLGLSFQQVQKYEKGTNRCAPSRLSVIAKAVGKPVAWFFDEAGGGGTATPDLALRLLTATGGKALAEAFLATGSPGLRQALVHLAKCMAAETAAQRSEQEAA